ncbi:MAG: HAMP domain-containing sensor histidine kinase [Candidatus Margulisiibacteriota bacterium]
MSENEYSFFTMSNDGSDILSLHNPANQESTTKQQIQALATENKRLKEKYKKARNTARVYEELLEAASHEFRTPLTTIIGYVELLTDGHFGALNQKQKHAMEIALSSGLYLKRSIDSLILLAKIKSRSLLLDFKIFDIYGVLQEVVSSLKPMADKKKIELIIKKKGPVFVSGDWQKLNTAFYHLVHNGITHTISGSVIISIDICEKYMHINVTDTGKGISERERTRLFNKFKTNTDHSNALNGQGLGLAITEGLAELHSGSVSVQSSVGKGSTFTVKLPLNLTSGFFCRNN